MTETPRNAGSDAPPSLDELARRLLDLWQDQLSAAAANPDLASQAARLMAALPLPGMWLSQMGQMGQMGQTSGLQSGMPGSSPNVGADIAKAWAELSRNWMQPAETGSQTDGSQHAATTPRATPAAAASQPGGLDMDELRARLAGLEKRLGELTAKPKPKSKPATKRKSKPVGGGDARTGAVDPKRRPTPTDDGTAG